MSSKIHILQHIPTDGPTLIRDWLEARGREARVVRIDHGEPIPEASDVSQLIVLGGTMNVDQEREHPWLRDEKKLLEAHLRSERPVLGICLGGQMLARVLGARVTRNRGWEIGWHPVRFGGSAGSGDPREVELFQWHEDTFEIPAGARRLASSAACENQAFAYGPRALALQFHPEVDEAWIRLALADVALPDAGALDRIQEPEAMLADVAPRVERSRAYLFELLDGLFGGHSSDSG